MERQLHGISCDVALAPSEIPADFRGGVIVVMDVLRATTTIAYALQNGARGVIPCEEPADALTVRDRLGTDVLLGGERNSVVIPGFDLDNSPLSYTRERVANRSVAFTTTNGTRALRRAAQASPREVLCGAFVNLSAVAGRVLQMQACDVLLACAGSEGRIALEDLLLAGALALRLSESAGRHDLSDGAKAAVLAYKSAAGDLAAAIASSEHAHALIEAGFAEDIHIAAQIDAAVIVPVLRDNEIIRLESAPGPS